MEFALTRLPRIRKSLDLKKWVNSAFENQFKVLDVSKSLTTVDLKNPLISLLAPADADFSDLFVQEAIKNYPAFSERQNNKKVDLFLADWKQILAYFYKNRHTIPFTVGQQLSNLVDDSIPDSIPQSEQVDPLSEVENITLEDAIEQLKKLSAPEYYVPVVRAGKENQNALHLKLSLLEKRIAELSSIPKVNPISVPVPPTDFRTRVIEKMHGFFAIRERLTKGQVSKLGLELGIVDEGHLWEAVELAWVLWYRKLNEQPKAFEERYADMVDFYYDVQPTYAYSDSSKMLFQQYSTSGPLAALACWYAGADLAQSIFEPSAGNGLLLIGAPYEETTVNEIDPQRLQSLQAQPFELVLNQDGSQAFEAFYHKFDVVLTNPPFGTWREDADVKAQFSKEFMGGFRGTNRVRLDHVMCVHALNTMKDDGKAVLIIGGWFDFGPDGHVRKHVAFFNWLYYLYQVDDIININQFKMYFKQGAAQNSELMMILIGGRKAVPGYATPNVRNATTELRTVAYDFPDVLERVRIAKSSSGKPKLKEIERVAMQLQAELSE